MKIICKILAFGTIALSVGGCDLTMLPEHELSPEQYFQNESDLTLWSNQFYNDNLESADIGINDADDKIDNGLSDYITGSRNAASQTWSFSALRKINHLLEHLDQCPDRALATKYEAVARFFRAYFYFLKVRTYGDVPYYDHVLGSTDADVYKARDDRGYVMDRVLEDFDFAARNLPGTWESGNTRVTKWAALAYASRAPSTRGRSANITAWPTPTNTSGRRPPRPRSSSPTRPSISTRRERNPTANFFYSENAKTCEVVLPPLRQSLRHLALGALQHQVRPHEPHAPLHEPLPHGRRLALHRQGGLGRRCRTARRRRAAIRAWRRPSSVRATSRWRPRPSRATPLSSHTGYEPIKFVGTAANSTTSGAASSDWILMRAAEVYLNYAEAVAELGTITQNDLEISVNLIRKRAKMTGIDLTKADASPDPYLLECYPNVTKSAHTGVILEIRRERTVELVMEPPYRSWDLFRWNECKQALNHYRPYYGCYIAGAGTYDMDNDGTPDLELYIDEATSSCPTKLQIGKEVILSEETKGYIVGYRASSTAGTGTTRATTSGPFPPHSAR